MSGGRRIKSWPASVNPNQLYPWAEWTDGSVWTITEGRDYHVGSHSMRAQLHVRAAAQDLSVRVTATDGGLTFQFQPRPSPKGAA